MKSRTKIAKERSKDESAEPVSAAKMNLERGHFTGECAVATSKSLLEAQQFQNDMEISNNLPSPLSRFPFEDYFPISCALSGLVFIEQLEATRCSLFAPSAMCTFRRYLFKSKRLFKQIRGVWGIDLERLRDCFISGVAESSRG